MFMRKESALPPLGAVYSMYIKELKRYGAYQILHSDSEEICYLVLDYLEEVPPDPKYITSFQPFYQERYQYYHQLEICQIPNRKVPKDYLFIGVYPLAAKKECTCFSERWKDGKEYIYEMEWQTADPKQRAAYKKYCGSKELVKVGKQYFKKNLNGMKTELYQIAGKEFSIEQFPCITFVEVKGKQKGLLKCLEYADLIHTLRWWSPQIKVLDLRKTAIRCLEIDADGVEKIYLSKKIRRVELYGTISPCLQILGEPKEYDLFLSVTWQPNGIFSYGLEHVGELRILNSKELDLKAVLPFFKNLTSLSLQGYPGWLSGWDQLEILSKLEELEIKDLFGYTAADTEVLEQIPKLKRLYLSGIPDEVGQSICRKWKGKLDLLEMSRLRSESWQKENLENPFQHWDENKKIPTDAVKKAAKQYKKTKQIFKQAFERERVILAVREYAARFNRLNHRYAEFIETEQKADIFSALKRIYRETFMEERGLIGIEEITELLDGERENW